MPRQIALVAIPFVLCVVRFAAALKGADSSELTGNAPNESAKAAQSARSSDKAVVKDVVYGLEEESDRLYLTSQSIDGPDRELKRVEVKFDIPKDAKVTELSLAKLDGKNLMAVLKLRRGDEREFHCLTFIAPPGGHVREKFGFHQAKFFTTHDDLKVLAVCGKHFEGSVFVVLGKMGTSEKQFSTITEGVFYFAACPWPPSDGALSPFRVESIPPKQSE